MAKGMSAQELNSARLSLDVLQAAQKGARTPGWFRGEVRGKEAVGTATSALIGNGLVDASTFRLTAKGKSFVNAQVKNWDTFLEKIDKAGNLEKIAKALQQAATSKK